MRHLYCVCSITVETFRLHQIFCPILCIKYVLSQSLRVTTYVCDIKLPNSCQYKTNILELKVSLILASAVISSQSEARSYNNQPLEAVNTIKLLGVYLTSDLKWTTHIRHISSKASNRLYALRILFVYYVWETLPRKCN